MPKENDKFDYPKNLRFYCTKCGICCGDTKERCRSILLLKREVEDIAKEVLKPISDFTVNSEEMKPYSYKMKKTENGKCVFLKDNRCIIYPLRPLICKFYPFELKVMNNKKYKFLQTEECPGINEGQVLRKSYFQRMFLYAKRKFESIADPKE